MHGREHGFTLLEMLVVLAIAGLMIALVGPRVLGRIDAVRGNMELQDVVNQLEILPRRAQLAGRSVELPRDKLSQTLPDGLPLVALPEGWSIAVKPDLVIGANGLCSPATVSIRSGKEADTELARYRVEGSTCRLASDAQ